MANLFTAEDILAEFEAGDLDPPGLLSWKRWLGGRTLVADLLSGAETPQAL